MNQYVVCIATKGRAGSSKTIAALRECGSNFELFVEPQDAVAYRQSYPGAIIVVLPENNKGISFVRQFILQHNRALSRSWFWMLDDDINQTYEVVNKKCVKLPITETLRRAENIITQQNVALGSLEYQQYAWSSAKPLRFNSYCEVAVLISVERTKFINYREGCKEDRDFVLQNLSAGNNCVRTAWLAFSAPKNGSVKGGLYDAYKGGLESHWSTKMIKLWPGVCSSHIKPDGRPDVKINWKLFKK